MAKSTVVIGCRLPHGLILSHPLAKNKTVTVAGLNKALIIGSTYVTTPVDAELWEAWKAAHGDFPALQNGALFEAAGEREAADKGKELAGERTGFEAMSKDAPGIAEMKA